MKKAMSFLMVLIMSATVFTGCGNDDSSTSSTESAQDTSYMKIAEEYMLAVEQIETKKKYSYLHPDAIDIIFRDSMSELSTAEEYIDYMAQFDEDSREDLKDMINVDPITITCKAKSASDYDIKRLGGIFRGIDVNIEEAKNVTVEVTRPHIDGGLDDVVDRYVLVAKIDGKWYVYMK